jgi:pimeloyl-ACP methyl ester carboxylesterase
VTDFSIDNASITLQGSTVGSGDDVLFLHGLSASGDYWSDVADSLADRYTCWSFDFRGHGRSDQAPGTYRIEDYASDVHAVLEHIGRAAVLVGHSLGGITAAYVAAKDHQLVKAIFLEDPPLFLGEPEAWNATPFPKLFPAIRDAAIQMREAGEPVEAYVELMAAAPSPAGGITSDHVAPRDLAWRGEALSRMDPTAWDTAIDLTLFADLDPASPIACPVKVLRGEPELGAAFLIGDDARLQANTPHAEVVLIDGVGHGIHSTMVSAARFRDELRAFLHNL